MAAANASRQAMPALFSSPNCTALRLIVPGVSEPVKLKKNDSRKLITALMQTCSLAYPGLIFRLQRFARLFPGLDAALEIGYLNKSVFAEPVGCFPAAYTAQ